MLDDRRIWSLLQSTIDKTPDIPNAVRHSGKVRESYTFPNGIRAIVVTDRISVFDKSIGTVPLKGRVLNQITTYWFQQLATMGVRSHFISCSHPNVSLNIDVKPLPLEIVVRGYLTGATTTSAWYAYQHADRMISGIRMPENMKKNEPFAQPMITPAIKATHGHDMNISRDAVIKDGHVPEAVYAEVEKTALRMFAHGQRVAAERGLVLVDTKYEMGLDRAGRLVVIDEVHTPDSSRYWIRDSYESRLSEGREPESLDKEFVRRMIVEAGYDINSDDEPIRFMTDAMRVEAAKRYLELLFRLTGQQVSDDEAAPVSILEALTAGERLERP